MAEANVATGLQIHPGRYRVPDLLTEEEFIAYMWDIYRAKVTFEHAEATINVPELAGVEEEKEEAALEVEPEKEPAKTTPTSTTTKTSGSSSKK